MADDTPREDDAPAAASDWVEKPAVTDRPNDLVAGSVSRNSTFADRAKSQPRSKAVESADDSTENKAVKKASARRKSK